MKIFVKSDISWLYLIMKFILDFIKATPYMFLTYMFVKYDNFNWVNLIICIIFYFIIDVIQTLKINIKTGNYEKDEQ
jgi:hypothetical protein